MNFAQIPEGLPELLQKIRETNRQLAAGKISWDTSAAIQNALVPESRPYSHECGTTQEKKIRYRGRTGKSHMDSAEYEALLNEDHIPPAQDI